MKRLFLLVLVLTIILVAVGFYRGWLTVSSQDSDKGSNKVELNLTVDQDKMKDDANAVKEKALDLTGGAKGDEKNEEKDAGDQ